MPQTQNKITFMGMAGFGWIQRSQPHFSGQEGVGRGQGWQPSALTDQAQSNPAALDDSQGILENTFF